MERVQEMGKKLIQSKTTLVRPYQRAVAQQTTKDWILIARPTQPPVGRFIEPVSKCTTAEVEVVGISCGIFAMITRKIKACMRRWQEINGMEILLLHEKSQIRTRHTVELGGYTGGQRLRVLTAKPAPIH